jgi:hypothetical protein
MHLVALPCAVLFCYVITSQYHDVFYDVNCHIMYLVLCVIVVIVPRPYRTYDHID